MSQPNLTPAVDYEMVNQIASAIQKSQTQLTMYDMAIFIFLLVGSLSVLLYVLWRMGIVGKTVNGNGNNSMNEIKTALENVTSELHKATINTDLATNAHNLILTKDSDKIPILLSIPKLLRDNVKVLDRLSRVLDKIEIHLHK